MKIQHAIPVTVSCKNMHTHWIDTMHLEYSDAAPLEFTLALRDRVDGGNGNPVPDLTWTLPRGEFSDALLYDPPGTVTQVGCATVKIRVSKPHIVAVCVPFWDDQERRNVPQYLLFKISKLRVFLADAERVVPQSCEDVALDVDRLIGRLLYS